MDIKVDLSTKGLDEVTERLPLLDNIVQKIARDALARAVTAIKTGPKTGRFYRSSGIARNYKTGAKRATQLSAMGLRGRANAETGKTRFSLGAKLHRASAPGEAPASDKGILAASAFIKRIAKGLFQIGFSANYARILEEEKNRPFLGPAIASVESALRQAIESIFKGSSSE